MCSPLVFGAIISAAATVAGTAMQMSAANAARARQAAANREAAAYNARKRREFIRRDEELNRQQRQEQDIALRRIGEAPEEREEEESRLSEEFVAPLDTAVSQAQTTNDALISGTEDTGRVIQSSFGRQLNEAANEARGRIGALATLQSYGPSQFGLTNSLADIFRDTGANIDMYGNFRRGERGVYNMARSIGAANAPAGDLAARGDIGSTLTTVGSYGLGRTAGPAIKSAFGGGIS